ncbi:MULTISPECIES: type IV conjugative transfer system protein TraV [Vibrio]|uniref:Type IV conjugative transfer system protein TraV n=1 Tax=Vibrio parahaemolyticus TaxID=670 RepID=A0AA47JNJ7_VIBPH|nr:MULTISPECIES: type IV conjugative transfer system protein TraV [Vibrio]MBE3780039.1 type IV conjugative transfer system protein TraV [Vibrio parahaemolyticus]MBE4231421.1 type IV conjugative transfer system protein TraV [Vibrio parahaemolyticus]MCZ6249625.1 type IV conjugative transfer system protein TraV [Vibrio parahaemolyticus]MCZ6279368.1 type IV conjugative transfer system protein TraV [Vibrio parahaemolyticus]MCZ6417377.1 type IV conjugative transfer system protein TraV [Vibrio paraha
MSLKSFSIMVLLISTLSGCSAGFQDEFSCQKIGGSPGCASMDEIRNAIDAPHPQDAIDAKALANHPFALLPRRSRDGHPTRTQDTVRKVVIFPFTSDDTKTYLDTMDIYILLDESTWTGRPVQSIKKD